MKIKTMLIAAQLLCGIASATEFNLANDYSTNSNPNGSWTYGWFHNTIPGGSSLELLSWSGSQWAGGSGAAIWKNDTESPMGNVATGQVALVTYTNTPAVVRWTAPAEIGLSTIQIAGEFAIGVSGIEIRRGAGVFHSFTNTSSFNVEMMVEPGDEIDFVGVGNGTKPLDLTITTLKENLVLKTFDDFDHHLAAFKWTTVPVWGPCTQTSESLGGGLLNHMIVPGDTYGWSKGMYRDLPFAVTTNTSHLSIRSFHRLGVKPYSGGSYGLSGIRLCADSITTGDTQVVDYFHRGYALEGNATKIYFRPESGDAVISDDAPDLVDYNAPTPQWIEYRADMDFSYESADGSFGLFSLFKKESGQSKWRPVDGMANLEMKIVDPTVITKLCLLAHHDGGARPETDDIRICTGENDNLGANTNLLISPEFSDDGITDWRSDGSYVARVNSDAGFHGNYVTCEAYPQEVFQVVNLLNQGFATADIDSGIFNVEFGGWQYGSSIAGIGTSAGQIEIEFLDIDQQPISIESLPVVGDSSSSWVEQMVTHPIPPSTRSIRYVATLSTNARLDDAYLAVSAIPQEDKALTVASIHGSPTPAAGTTSNSWGTVVTCSVANVTSGLTNYSCIGWTGTGSVPSSGTSNSVEVTLTEDSSITWLWQTNYWLETSVSGSGSVDVVDGFYAKNSEQILTASPDAGWLFMGWSGDASGTNSEAFVFMTEPQTVTATFSDDADNDGLTNTEEEGYGSDPWKKDTDGDGFGDKLEVDNGGSPTASDAWRTDYIRANGEDFNLYPSNVVLDVAVGEMLLDIAGGEASLNLQLQTSEDLVAWTNAGDAVEWIWPVDGEKKFFRVRSY